MKKLLIVKWRSSLLCVQHKEYLYFVLLRIKHSEVWMLIVFSVSKEYLKQKFYNINLWSQHESKGGMDYSRDKIELPYHIPEIFQTSQSIMQNICNISHAQTFKRSYDVISKCTLPSSRTGMCCWDLIQAALRTYVRSTK